MTNIRECECCGQQRPYPMQAGRWKYKTLTSRHWTKVTVREVEEGLEITADGDTEPMWWPNYAQWEELHA